MPSKEFRHRGGERSRRDGDEEEGPPKENLTGGWGLWLEKKKEPGRSLKVDHPEQEKPRWKERRSDERDGEREEPSRSLQRPEQLSTAEQLRRCEERRAQKAAAALEQ